MVTPQKLPQRGSESYAEARAVSGVLFVVDPATAELGEIMGIAQGKQLAMTVANLDPIGKIDVPESGFPLGIAQADITFNQARSVSGAPQLIAGHPFKVNQAGILQDPLELPACSEEIPITFYLNGLCGNQISPDQAREQTVSPFPGSGGFGQHDIALVVKVGPLIKVPLTCPVQETPIGFGDVCLVIFSFEPILLMNNAALWQGLQGTDPALVESFEIPVRQTEDLGQTGTKDKGDVPPLTDYAIMFHVHQREHPLEFYVHHRPSLDFKKVKIPLPLKRTDLGSFLRAYDFNSPYWPYLFSHLWTWTAQAVPSRIRPEIP